MLIASARTKKANKKAAMRSNLQIGDEVVTFGGSIGIIVSIKDDTLVVETGNERSKIRILRKAVESCLTVREEEYAQINSERNLIRILCSKASRPEYAGIKEVWSGVIRMRNNPPKGDSISSAQSD